MFGNNANPIRVADACTVAPAGKVVLVAWQALTKGYPKA
jgi:hypothetical protein